MKKLLISVLLSMALPMAVYAQSATSSSSDKPTVSSAKKSSDKSRSASKKTSVRHPMSPKKLKRSAAKAVEEVTPIAQPADVVLSKADLDTAQEVYVGPIKCELGENVMITADAQHPGFFDVQVKKTHYRMHPVDSRTGAIRLEDPHAGAMWLQLGNKSMLMNQKIGERLADECQSPQQVTAAEAMKKNPPKSLLE